MLLWRAGRLLKVKWLVVGGGFDAVCLCWGDD